MDEPASPNVPESRFLQLPLPIQHEVFNLLPPVDQGAVALISKTAHAFVSSNTLTRLDVHLSQTQNLPGISPLASHLTSVQNVTLRLQLTSSTHTSASNALTPAAFLSWFTQHYSALLQRLPSLTLYITDSTATESAESLRQLLYSCSSLRQLEVIVPLKATSLLQPLKSGEFRLVINEPVAGQGLRDLGDLFTGRCDRHPCPWADDHPILLEMVLSEACRRNLHTLVNTSPADSVFHMLHNLAKADLSSGLFQALRKLHLGVVLPPPPGLLPQLTQLTELKVQDSGSSQWMSTIPHLTNLVQLHYKGPDRCTGALTLPPSWEELRVLRRLDLELCCKLAQDCPVWQLTSLRHLSIFHHCASEATTSHSQISALKSLTSLHIECQELHSSQRPPWFTSLMAGLPHGLLDLQLKCRTGSADLPSASRLLALTALHVTSPSCRPSAVTGITHLTSLEHLALNCRIDAMDASVYHLRSLTQLTSLSVTVEHSSPQSALWQALDAAGQLRELHLSDIHEWPAVIPSSITALYLKDVIAEGSPEQQLPRCQELQVLHVEPAGYCPLCNMEAVAKLTGLRQLKLMGVAHGSCVSYLDCLTRLTFLVVEGHYPVHGEWPRLKALNRLKVVVLGGFEEPPLENKGAGPTLLRKTKWW